MSRKSKAEYIGEKRRAYACASAAKVERCGKDHIGLNRNRRSDHCNHHLLCLVHFIFLFKNLLFRLATAQLLQRDLDRGRFFAL